MVEDVEGRRVDYYFRSTLLTGAVTVFVSLHVYDIFALADHVHKQIHFVSVQRSGSVLRDFCV